MTRPNKKLILGFVIVFLIVGSFFSVVGIGKKVGVIPSSFLTAKPKVLGANLEDVHNSAIEDSDSDGLVNIVEQQLGTNTNSADTDGDGFTDGEEVQSGHDPLKKPDGTTVDPMSSSGDGLSGISDGTDNVTTDRATNSTSNSSDDFSEDSDRDGLNDAQEKLLGTNINKQDTDGDGYTDTEELLNGYDPLKK